MVALICAEARYSVGFCFWLAAANTPSVGWDPVGKCVRGTPCLRSYVTKPRTIDIIMNVRSTPWICLLDRAVLQQMDRTSSDTNLRSLFKCIIIAAGLKTREPGHDGRNAGAITGTAEADSQHKGMAKVGGGLVAGEAWSERTGGISGPELQASNRTRNPASVEVGERVSLSTAPSR